MANTANVLSVHSDVLAILQQAVKDSAPTIMNLAQAAVTSAQDLHKVLKDKDEEMERLRNQLKTEAANVKSNHPGWGKRGRRRRQHSKIVIRASFKNSASCLIQK